MKHVPLFLALVVALYLLTMVMSPGNRQLALHLIEIPLQWLVLFLGLSVVVYGAVAARTRKATIGHPVFWRLYREKDIVVADLEEYCRTIDPKILEYVRKDLEEFAKAGAEVDRVLKGEDESEESRRERFLRGR